MRDHPVRVFDYPPAASPESRSTSESKVESPIAGSVNSAPGSVFSTETAPEAHPKSLSSALAGSSAAISIPEDFANALRAQQQVVISD